ncbi:hypothetical protein O0L34_g15853 [Tuta absoluta]|nr:hypothetical protein O0L34_g15853 [Tuta absoluta]
MDEVSLHQILSSNFSEVEIESAKNVLYGAINLQVVSRKGTGKLQRHLQDIVKTIKDAKPDTLPVFVARDLRKLPPVSFDHVDVTKLLKDITLLKQEIFLIKNNYSTIKATQVLKEEIVDLKQTLEDQRVFGGSFENSLDTLVEVECSGASTKGSATSLIEEVTRQPSSGSEVVQNKNKLTKLKSSNLTSIGGTGSVDDQQDKSKNSGGQQLRSDGGCKDSDGFQLVQYGKKNKNRVGTASPPLSSRIKAAPQVLHIFVSQLSPDVTEADLTEYITAQVDEQSRPLRVYRLGSTENKNFASFKVTVQEDCAHLYLSETFWPVKVTFRLFENRNNFKSNLSAKHKYIKK